MKFKIGSKVRVTKQTSPKYFKARRGDIGKVTRMPKAMDDSYHVKFERGFSERCWERELSLIKAKKEKKYTEETIKKLSAICKVNGFYLEALNSRLRSALIMAYQQGLKDAGELLNSTQEEENNVSQ